MHNTVIDKPCYHADHIGFSNNFAIQKKYFIHIGGFRKIFSPGAFGFHANDADLLLRILIDKKPIVHNPNMIVWHDHWLNETEAFQKNLLYIGGEVACYGLYALKGYAVGFTVLYRNFVTIPYAHIREIIRNLIRFKLTKAIKNARILCVEGAMRYIALCRSLLIFFANY